MCLEHSLEHVQNFINRLQAAIFTLRRVNPILKKRNAIPYPPAKVLYAGQAGMPAFFALLSIKFDHFRSIMKI